MEEILKEKARQLEIEKERARVLLAKVIKSEIKLIADYCPPSYLESLLHIINNIIETGRQIKVTTVSSFSEEEVKELVEKISPLRTLKMNADAYTLLKQTLINKGLDPEFFVSAEE